MTASGRLTGRTWSLILGCVAVWRAASYAVRPPSGESAAVVEGLIPYSAWSVLLLLCGLTLIAGVSASDRRAGKWLKLAGHFVLLFAYATFFLSVAVAALISDAGWSGSGASLVVAVLHFERVATLLHDLFRGGKQ